MKPVYIEHPLLMPSLRGTISCTGCGRLIGRGEGQSFYRVDADGKPTGPAGCWGCAQRWQVEAERDALRTALERLTTKTAPSAMVTIAREALAALETGGSADGT